MLVVFDVDGTLSATGSIDGELYERTFREEFGRGLPTTDWATYQNATDRGIAEEAIRRLGLDPCRLERFRDRFVAELGSALEARGAQAIPGAETLLERLDEAGHGVAIATGAWEKAARAKLAAAGVAFVGHVLVGSDAHAAREDIVREAIRRSGRAARTVYVGDGIWDVRAARRLHLPFVGVDPESMGALRREGVSEVVRDYREVGVFISALERARVP